MDGYNFPSGNGLFPAYPKAYAEILGVPDAEELPTKKENEKELGKARSETMDDIWAWVQEKAADAGLILFGVMLLLAGLFIAVMGTKAAGTVIEAAA